MARTVLPWLLTLACLAVLVATRVFDEPAPAGPAAAPPPDLVARLEGVERELAELRAEVRSLRSEPRSATGGGSVAAAPAGKSPAAAMAPPAKPQSAPSRFGPLTLQQASQKARIWYDAIRQLDDREARARAVAAIQAAFESDDDATLLAGLYAARWSRTAEYDRDLWRRLILPHAATEEPVLRRAALEALLVVQPDPADLGQWLKVARSADRQNAESTASSLVLLADGRVEGEVADAVLHLLRPGTNIKAAFVIRGLQAAKTFDPRVEARLIEIVRKARPSDYDSAYFFHFLARNLAPKSDAMVDLILDRAAGGQGELESILRSLDKGLDERQRARAAERVMTMAENAGTEWARAAALNSLARIAGPAQAARLEALAADPDLNANARQLAAAAAKAARRRN